MEFIYFYSGFVTGIIFAIISGGYILYRKKQREVNIKKEIPKMKIDTDDLKKAEDLTKSWEQQFAELLNFGGIKREKELTDDQE